MSGLDRAERSAHRLGALVAIAAATTALPGLVRVVRERGPAGGCPELVFTPLRLLLIGAGWFGAAVASWRPLPVRTSHATRWMLLAGGLGLYLAGMGLAVAGRLALGSSYRPSSTLGARLAPNHRLVTSGPFAIVRHPMYLGLALAALGALAVYRTWSTVLFVLQVPVLVVRAHREEELLARTFGAAWERYAALVPAWLPRCPGLAAAPSSPVAMDHASAAAEDPRAPQAAPVTARVRILIPRDREVVFDYFADLRNEPQYNRQVSGIRKTSPGPIGLDTTFEGSHRGLGPVTWRLSEYERPEHVVIEGSVGRGAYLWTSDFEPSQGGTWMTGTMEWTPPRRWRPLRPLLGAILQLNAQRSFRRMAQVLQRAGLPTE